MNISPRSTSRFKGKRSSDDSRDVELRAVIVDGMLAIEIGLNTLKRVVDRGPLSFEWKLLDVDALARDVAIILEEHTDEVGMTPIMHVLDAAVELAVGNGTTAVTARRRRNARAKGREL